MRFGFEMVLISKSPVRVGDHGMNITKNIFMAPVKGVPHSGNIKNLHFENNSVVILVNFMLLLKNVYCAWSNRISRIQFC